MVTLEHLKQFHLEVEVGNVLGSWHGWWLYSSDSLWLDKEGTCFTFSWLCLSRSTTRHFIICFSFFFVSHKQSWENIFDQTSGYIDVYIFVWSSVICSLVSYIFLTLYVGGKWAGNFRHPFRGYFVMVTLEHLKQFHLEVRYCVKVGNVLRRWHGWWLYSCD